MNKLQALLNREVASCLRHTIYHNWEVTTHGESNVPTNGPAIITPIHTSTHDGYLLLAHSERPLSIVKRYDQRHDVPSHLIEQLRMIAACAVGSVIINRSTSEPDSMDALSRFGLKPPTLRQFSDQAQGVLEGGQLLCMFPQSERRPRNKIGQLARGAGTLALITRSPIIPTDIYISDHTAAITFGEPIQPFGNARTLTALLHERLEDFTLQKP